MQIHIKSKYVNETVELFRGRYGNGTTAIIAFGLSGERMFVATVAIAEIPFAAGCVFLKGWTENEGIPEALEAAGVVNRTGRTEQTGYCEAEEAELLVELPGLEKGKNDD